MSRRLTPRSSRHVCEHFVLRQIIPHFSMFIPPPPDHRWTLCPIARPRSAWSSSHFTHFTPLLTPLTLLAAPSFPRILASKHKQTSLAVSLSLLMSSLDHDARTRYWSCSRAKKRKEKKNEKLLDRLVQIRSHIALHMAS